MFAPNFYKWQQKGSRIAWFDRIAKEKDIPLHAASGWSYLSEDQYNGMFSIYVHQIFLFKIYAQKAKFIQPAHLFHYV